MYSFRDMPQVSDRRLLASAPSIILSRRESTSLSHHPFDFPCVGIHASSPPETPIVGWTGFESRFHQNPKVISTRSLGPKPGFSSHCSGIGVALPVLHPICTQNSRQRSLVIPNHRDRDFR